MDKPAKSLNDVLSVWLPYRIKAVHAMLWALELRQRAGAAALLEVRVANGARIEGNTRLLADSIIEVGYVHLKGLLEFSGIGTRDGHLVQIDMRSPGDMAIEHYSVNEKQLEMLTPEELYAAIGMPRLVAEWVLVAVIESAKNQLCQSSSKDVILQEMDTQIRSVCEGIAGLLQDHLYRQLSVQSRMPRAMSDRLSRLDREKPVEKRR
jgi:hypothetical protein